MTDEAKPDRETNTDHCDLRSCPFCGCEAWIHEHGMIFGGASGHRVECEGQCHAMTCYWHSEKAAIDAWNKRAAAPDLLAAAKEALAFLTANGMSHGKSLAAAIAKADSDA